jgi:hypothetical protein
VYTVPTTITAEAEAYRHSISAKAKESASKRDETVREQYGEERERSGDTGFRRKAKPGRTHAH